MEVHVLGGAYVRLTIVQGVACSTFGVDTDKPGPVRFPSAETSRAALLHYSIVCGVDLWEGGVTGGSEWDTDGAGRIPTVTAILYTHDLTDRQTDRQTRRSVTRSVECQCKLVRE